jgi:hypothetical protein
MKLVDFEKLLPEDLPAGERVLWHGRPDWPSLTRRALRAEWVAGYFVVMAAWNFASATEDFGLGAAVLAAGKTLGAGVLSIALLAGLAWLSSRTTLYVVTTRRVVMKIGIALPIFLNIPFGEIASASLRRYGDETGDIPLALRPERRIAYLHLWPHARPFRFTHPEPSLRCIPKATEVAERLSRALIAFVNERDPQSVIQIGAAPAVPMAARTREDLAFPHEAATA